MRMGVYGVCIYEYLSVERTENDNTWVVRTLTCLEAVDDMK